MRGALRSKARLDAAAGQQLQQRRLRSHTPRRLPMVRDDYDSGRNTIGADKNAGNVPQALFDGAEGPMKTHGNQDSMNLNNMLLVNIRTSDYFRLLADVTSFEGLVDQIYYDVHNAVPWVPGTHNRKSTTGECCPAILELARQPDCSLLLSVCIGMCGAVRGVSAAGRCTSCFCLLFKAFTLQLTPSQVNMLINHRDSPVRAIELCYQCVTSDLLRYYSTYAWLVSSTFGIVAGQTRFGSGMNGIWVMRRNFLFKAKSTTIRQLLEHG